VVLAPGTAQEEHRLTTGPCMHVEMAAFGGRCAEPTSRERTRTGVCTYKYDVFFFFFSPRWPRWSRQCWKHEFKLCKGVGFGLFTEAQVLVGSLHIAMNPMIYGCVCINTLRTCLDACVLTSIHMCWSRMK
jgi:hypothetical protein